MIEKLNRQFKPARGLTLVELMVALAVFSILMLGLGTMFQTNRRNANTQESFSRLQENARFALTMMAQDIRQAGFNGCNPKINVLLDTTDATYSPALFDFSSGVGGYEALGTGPGTMTTLTNYDPSTTSAGSWADSDGLPLANALDKQVVAMSDVLIVKGGLALPNMQPNGNTPQGAAAITFDNKTGIPAGTIVFVSDCQQADVFQNVNNENANSLSRAVSGEKPGNVVPADEEFSHDYSKDQVQIIIATSHAYFIGRNAITGQPGLFRINFETGAGGSAPQEIAEGVENMQILYGEDLNDDQAPDQYVTADAVTVPGNVVSVRVSLLVRSAEALPYRPLDTATYTLLGSTGTGTQTIINPQEGNADDTRFRRIFGTTVFLRNAAVTMAKEIVTSP